MNQCIKLLQYFITVLCEILGPGNNKLCYTNFKVEVITSFQYFSPNC